jgi:hypothetical protein
MDPVLNANNWSCESCQSKGTHATNLPNQQSLNQIHEPRFAGPTDCLTILQWNADGLNPKIAELGEFVKKHRVDVAMIQETKLMKDKRTPKLVNCTGTLQYEQIDRMHNSPEAGLSLTSGTISLTGR